MTQTSGQEDDKWLTAGDGEVTTIWEAEPMRMTEEINYLLTPAFNNFFSIYIFWSSFFVRLPLVFHFFSL